MELKKLPAKKKDFLLGKSASTFLGLSPFSPEG